MTTIGIVANDRTRVARIVVDDSDVRMLYSSANIVVITAEGMAARRTASRASTPVANGIELTRERICAEVSNMCVGMVDRELDDTGNARTAGERAFRRYGVSGARGEAASGYWTVRAVALPVYDRLRRADVSEEMALLDSLVHLLEVNSDTNLISRGGLAGLEFVREHARRLLLEGGVLATGGLEELMAFDDELIARNLSPGGSADLLIVTAFLARFEHVAQDCAEGRPERGFEKTG